VIGTAARKIIGVLEDSSGVKVTSEHFLEIDFVAGRPIQ